MNYLSKDITPDFNFFVEVDGNDLEKASKKVGDKRYEKMLISGIASDSSTDTDSEILEPAGFVLDRFLKLGNINYDHRLKDDPRFLIGEPVEAKVVDNKFFVKAKLYKDSEVARNLYDTMIMLHNSGSKKKLGFSIEGKALERHPQNQKRITKALITGLAATFSPKNSNSYADIVKGNYSKPINSYDVEKAIQSTNGGIVYLVDITNPKTGMRYTIDKDLNLKVEKAIDTTTAKPLIKESLEGKKKKKDAIINLANATMTGAISKSLFDKATENYKMSISDKNYNTIRKAFIEGKVSYDILEKAKAKNLQSKHAGSNWVTMNGAKVLIGGDGKVIAGAGGKFSGEGKKEAGKSDKDREVVSTKMENNGKRTVETTKEGGSFRITESTMPYKDNKNAKWVRVEHRGIDGKTKISSIAIDLYGGSKEKALKAAKERIEDDLKNESSSKKEGVSDKKESGKKESYHKDDKLNEFRDIAANSKDMSEFFTKVRAVKNVPPDVSQQFSDKYNPNENLSMESSAKKMFDEVKGSGKKKEKVEKKEIPKEVTKKVNDMKDLNNAAKKLDSVGIYDSKTYGTKPDVLKNMSDVAKKIDIKKLPSKTKEKLDKFLEELDNSIWLHDEPKESRKIRGVNNLQLDFQDKDTLSEKIDFINERLQYEEKTKEKEGLSDNKFEKKYGSLYGHEDVLDEAKDLIVEMSKEYVKKETTEVLQHKLF